MFSDQMTQEKLEEMYWDKYQYRAGLVGWIFYVILLAGSLYNFIMQYDSASLTLLMAVIMMGIAWWLRPEAES